jgi:calnexin
MLFPCFFGFALSLPLKPSRPPFHFEPFSDGSWSDHWQPTALKNYTGHWRLRTVPDPQGYRGEKMLFAANPSAYHAVGFRFPKPLICKKRPFVIQYEVRFAKGIVCGGAYIKLFGSPSFDPLSLSNATQYSIMFGPDKCGDTNKVHFIFMHPHPITGVLEEKHLNSPPMAKTDRLNHLYTLIVRPDQTFSILIDAELVHSGSLFTNFTPPVNLPHTIDDPEDRKPADWVDAEMIPDASAQKPTDWDEDAPEFIPDPDLAVPPADWLPDEPPFIPDPDAVPPEGLEGARDPPMVPNPKCATGNCGRWEPPPVENPAFRGRWTPPLIKNPAFKGKWRPRQIPNPQFRGESDAFAALFPLTGVGFELWAFTSDTAISNVYIGTNEGKLARWNKLHFIPKHKQQEATLRAPEDDGAFPQTRTPKPKPTPRAGSEGATGAMTDFALNVRDAWNRLYRRSPEAIGMATVMIGAVGLLIVLACHTRGRVDGRVPSERRTRYIVRSKAGEQEGPPDAAQTE